MELDGTREKKGLDEPGEGAAEAVLVMVICLVVAVGMIRLAVESINLFFLRVATALGLT